jgi:hypothetical protein
MAQRTSASGPAEMGESLKELAADLGVLLKQDLEDARNEMLEKAKAAGTGAGLFSGSVITGLLTLFSLAVLMMVLLSAILKLWIAVSIVTVFWGLLTALLVLVGRRKFTEAGPPIPERAIAHVKADLKAAKEEARDAAAG